MTATAMTPQREIYVTVTTDDGGTIEYWVTYSQWLRLTRLLNEIGGVLR